MKSLEPVSKTDFYCNILQYLRRCVLGRKRSGRPERPNPCVFSLRPCGASIGKYFVTKPFLRPALLFLVMALSFTNCTRPPIKNQSQAMRPAPPPVLSDDLNLEDLGRGVEAMIESMRIRPPHEIAFEIGTRQVTSGEYLQTLQEFLPLLLLEKEQFFEAVLTQFDFYEVYGSKRWGEVLLTSYFTPQVSGKTKPSDNFTQPIYRTPADLLHITLPRFEAKYDLGTLRGRLLGKTVLPYFSRSEIDGGGILKGKGLEICYVDPFDAFTIHTQGSGRIELGTKSVTLGYADQNGHPYKALGKFLLGTIPIEKMSLYQIEVHFRELAGEDQKSLLFKNPSYIFFQQMQGLPKTSLGVDVVSGRTIATDGKLFPKGAIGFLEFETPQFEEGKTEPTSWKKTSRFVLNTDSGGAIKGPGRVDLFWGFGEKAKKMAGVIRQTGKLFFIVPKPAANNRNG